MLNDQGGTRRILHGGAPVASEQSLLPAAKDGKKTVTMKHGTTGRFMSSEQEISDSIATEAPLASKRTRDRAKKEATEEVVAEDKMVLVEPEPQELTCTCPHLLSRRDRSDLLRSFSRVRQRSSIGTGAARTQSCLREHTESENHCSRTENITFKAGVSQCNECARRWIGEAEDLMVCLHCGATGCVRDRHIHRHMIGSNHTFAVTRAQGELYCMMCGDIVYDAEFDARRKDIDAAANASTEVIPTVSSKPTTDADADESSSPKYLYKRRGAYGEKIDETDTRGEGKDTTSTAAAVAPNRGWHERGSLSSKKRRLAAMGLRGMYNMGNTCFISCVLQAMIHNPLLRSFFHEKNHDSAGCKRRREDLPKLTQQVAQAAAALGASVTDGGANSRRKGGRHDAGQVASCIACELDLFFDQVFGKVPGELSMEDLNPCVPNRLLHTIWGTSESLAGYKQQDAHEFLIALLDTLHVDLMQAALNEAQTEKLKSFLHHYKSHRHHQASKHRVEVVSDVAPPIDPVYGGAMLRLPKSPKLHGERVQISSPRVPGLRRSSSFCTIPAVEDTDSNDKANGSRIEDLSLGGFVSKVFAGITRSDVVCLCCGHVSCTYERFLEISLSIREQVHHPSQGSGGSSSGGGLLGPSVTHAQSSSGNLAGMGATAASGSTTRSSGRQPLAPIALTDCLDRYTAVEHLGSGVECDGCHRKSASKTKQMSFGALPMVLMIQLKRFDAVAEKKVDDPVHFPATGLDMGAYLSGWALGGVQEQAGVPAPSLSYDLFAVINHNGGLSQGHYTSYVKEDGSWYRCDDVWVTAADEDEVLASQAYMLFYRRTE